MTAIITSGITFDTGGCGPDCISIDGRCCCYNWELTSSTFSDPALDSLVPPY